MGGHEVIVLLARNIKRFRSRRNWSQANLAEHSGLSIVYLSYIERGNKWPYLDTLVKLAAALGVEVYELIKPEEALSADTASILGKYIEETRAIIAKSLESMGKQTGESLDKLRDQYLGGL